MGNFFIFQANAPKMFTDNLAELHTVHTVDFPSQLPFCPHRLSDLNSDVFGQQEFLCCSVQTFEPGWELLPGMFFTDALSDGLFSPGCSSKSFKLYSPKEPPNGSTFPPFHPGTMLDRDVG